MYQEQKPTVLQLSSTNQKITVEMPWDASGEELCNAFYTAAIGITFNPTTILYSMKEFAEEQLSVLEPDSSNDEDDDTQYEYDTDDKSI